MTLKSWRLLAMAATLLGLGPVSCGGKDVKESEVVLLTTTSFQDSGLSDVLLPEFEKRTGHRVKMIVVGSGAALKQGALGEGDVLLCHSPEEEKRWMAEGNGVSRQLVMYNDFVLVGPPGDPAKIKGRSSVEAFKQIAAAQASFVSRGDRSGTHVRELSLWEKAGVKPKGQRWYIESGQSQGLTLEIASEQERYALTDRSTFLAHQKRLSLAALVENEPPLLNLYHLLLVNPERFPRVNAKGAKTFADFLLSADGQKRIGEFGKERFGRSLFVPAADKNEEELLGETK